MWIKDIMSEDLKILFVILVEMECVKTVNSGGRLRITSSTVVRERLQSDVILGPAERDEPINSCVQRNKSEH